MAIVKVGFIFIAVAFIYYLIVKRVKKLGTEQAEVTEEEVTEEERSGMTLEQIMFYAVAALWTVLMIKSFLEMP